MKKLIMCVALFASVAQAELSPMLIGGKPTDLKDFPASVYARLGGAACSATIVGPKVMAVAAHCLAYSKEAVFNIQGNTYRAMCELASEYSRNPTADWALCVIDKEVENIQFETFAKELQFKTGEKLLLTGYGCIQQGGGGGNDGIFRTGEAEVVRLPSGEDNDIITRGKVALCFGDSGGAAYQASFRRGKRMIVGINSRGNIRDTSLLVSVFTEQAKAFIEEFRKAHGEKICGYDEEIKGCRESVFSHRK